ncbi:hypothetical protein BHE74_00013723 [Ensete ventricosum]|nr:hypothetical protein BHE74_00013723 [Ensete ventricosum]
MNVSLRIGFKSEKFLGFFSLSTQLPQHGRLTHTFQLVSLSFHALSLGSKCTPPWPRSPKKPRSSRTPLSSSSSSPIAAPEVDPDEESLASALANKSPMPFLGAANAEKWMLVENIRACPEGAVCAFVSAEWARLVLARAAVVSVERWSTVGWREPAGPAREVGGWRGGARVGKRCLNSGRLRILAIRSGVGFPT